MDSCVCNVQHNPSNKNSAVTVAYDNIYGQNINDYFLDIIDVESETNSGQPYITLFTKKTSNGKDLNAGSGQQDDWFNRYGWSKFFWPIFNVL